MALTDAQLRAGAIAHINRICGTDFADPYIPPDLEVGIELMIKAMTEKNPNVASQALGDMSKSFFQNGSYKAALLYLKPFMKAKFIPFRR